MNQEMGKKDKLSRQSLPSNFIQPVESLDSTDLQSPQGLTFISIQGYFLGAVLRLNILFSIFCYRMKTLFVCCYNFLEVKTCELLLPGEQLWEI